MPTTAMTETPRSYLIIIIALPTLRKLDELKKICYQHILYNIVRTEANLIKSKHFK